MLKNYEDLWHTSNFVSLHSSNTWISYSKQVRWHVSINACAGLTNWLTDWSWRTDERTDWRTDRTDWLTDWLADWLTDWLTGWLTHSLSDWLAEGLTDSPTPWFDTDSVTHRLFDSMMKKSLNYFKPFRYFSLFSYYVIMLEMFSLILTYFC